MVRPTNVYIVRLEDCSTIFDDKLSKYCPKLLGIVDIYEFYPDLMRSIMGYELRRDLADADLGHYFRDAGMPPERVACFLSELCTALEAYISLIVPEKVHHENYEVIRNDYSTLYFREKC